MRRSGPARRGTRGGRRDLFLGALDDPGGPPRRVAAGRRRDLCVLDRPWAEARRDLAEVEVRATLVGGNLNRT